MSQLLLQLNWTYTAILYDNDDFGQRGVDGLLQASKDLDICFPEVIPIGNHNFTYIQSVIKDRIMKIGKFDSTNPPTRGIIVFGGYTFSQLVIQSVENIVNDNLNESTLQNPAFIFSERSVDMGRQFSKASRGAFIPSPRRASISQFQETFVDTFVNITKLYLQDNFLKEMYQEVFNCSLSDSQDDHACPAISDTDVRQRIPMSQFNQYAIQAVGAIVYATKIVHDSDTVCGPSEGICNNFINTSVTDKNDFFEVLTGKTINFDVEFGNFRISEFRKESDLKIEFGDTPEVRAVPENVFPVYEVYNYQTCSSTESQGCLVKVRLLFSQL